MLSLSKYEFLFRDAKQFLGLNHCQARCTEALHFHYFDFAQHKFNASMTALNLLKLEDRQQLANADSPSNKVISIASWKVRKFNEHLLERLLRLRSAQVSNYLGLNFSCIKPVLSLSKYLDLILSSFVIMGLLLPKTVRTIVMLRKYLL